MRRRARILLIGCGDIALRVARRLAGRFLLFGLARTQAQSEALLAAGVRPVPGDLDFPRTLARLRLAPQGVLHFAPPPGEGEDDPRTRHLLAVLGRGLRFPPRLVYISTTGVYGNRQGAWVRETDMPQPRSARARRRVAAEQLLRQACRRHQTRLTILRAPGIYAADRLPLERLRAHTPVLLAEEDSYTNHVHAEDLARAAIAALRLGRGGRAFNVSDDATWRMGEWFDRLADACDLPRPPRLTRAAAEKRLTAIQWSFMSESRRLMNDRLKRELRFRFQYPTAETLLATLAHGGKARQGGLPE